MKIGIRLIGILIALAVVDVRVAFNYGIELLTITEHPVMMAQGLLELIWWLCGAVAAILLLIVHRSGKWVLFAFFLLGIVATWISWVPFVWSIVNSVETGMYKFAIIHGTNLIIVIIVFMLYSQIEKQSNEPLNPDEQNT